MKDPSAAIQASVWAKAVAATGVKAVLGDPARIYDKPPAAPQYPWTRIGEDQVLDDANSCGDGWEVFVTLHTFGQDVSAPRKEVKLIHDALLQALCDDASLPSPSGVEMVLANLESSRVYMEADGVTAHGVLTIRYLVNDT